MRVLFPFEREIPQIVQQCGTPHRILRLRVFADEERASIQLVGFGKVSSIQSNVGLRGEGIRGEGMIVAESLLVHVECPRDKLLGLRPLSEMLVRGGQPIPCLGSEWMLRAKRTFQDRDRTLEERLRVHVVAFHLVTMGEKPQMFRGEEIVRPSCAFHEGRRARDERNGVGVIAHREKPQHVRYESPRLLQRSILSRRRANAIETNRVSGGLRVRQRRGDDDGIITADVRRDRDVLLAVGAELVLKVSD